MKKTIKTKWGFIGYFVGNQTVGIHLCKVNTLCFCIDHKDDFLYLVNHKGVAIWL
jgi:hypothetical protein